MVALRQLPWVLMTGALVAIFLSLQRRVSFIRVRYWIAGWGLMLLHLLSPLFETGTVTPHFAAFVELSTLQLACLVFLISVSGVEDRFSAATLLAVMLAAPLVVYALLMGWEVAVRWPYLLCLGLFCFGGASRGLVQQRHRATQVVPIAAFALCAWMLYRMGYGDIRVGFFGMLLILSGVTAMLFARRYPKMSPGAVATCLGFVSWAGGWAIWVFDPGWAQSLGPRHGLWNVPNFIVACGMIVLLLEEESLAARTAQEQLQHFADITSQLLSGGEVQASCDHIARVITEATTFSRVAILLTGDDRKLFLAGHAGLPDPQVAQLRQDVVKLTISAVEELCHSGRPVGQAAVILTASQAELYGVVPSVRHYGANPHWTSGDEMCVPLRSPRGSFVGLILLDEPERPEQVNREEISKIGMLAADIAVAVDNAAMQRQLVLTEKLAGLEQLLRGMAHEINNPLTAVLGYSELLADRTSDPELRHGLGIILREAQRIKGILGNLQRFARQDYFKRKRVDLMALLREILPRKSAEAQERGIEIIEQLPPALPPVAVDQAQLKQVFLNVLNNALDAVQTAEKKCVTVSAYAENSQVVLSFTDTGPGFTDVSRVFDPFFTTKSPGKGTGLGLSICYGVLKQHGGNITARNIQPAGACVTLELPIAQTSSQ
jgi:signal transduction histidine kinase